MATGCTHVFLNIIPPLIGSSRRLCFVLFFFFKLSYSLHMVMNEDAFLLADRLTSIPYYQVVFNSETSFIQLQGLCISRVRFSVQLIFRLFLISCHCLFNIVSFMHFLHVGALFHIMSECSFVFNQKNIAYLPQKLTRATSQLLAEVSAT